MQQELLATQLLEQLPRILANMREAQSVRTLFANVCSGVRFFVPGSCFNLWLRDDSKKRVCRVFHDKHEQSEKDHHSFPEFVSYDDASLLFRDWDRGSGWVHSESTDFPSCPSSRGTAFLRLATEDDLRLVLTACVPKEIEKDFRVEQLCLEAVGEAFLNRLHAIRGFRERNLLASISELAAMELSQEKFYEGVAKVVAVDFDASACSIFIDDPQRDALVFGGTTSGLFDRISGKEIKAAELTNLVYPRCFGMTGWIFDQLRTVRLFDADDPDELVQFNENFACAVDEEPITSELKPAYRSAELPDTAPRSFLGAPIFADGVGVGVIRLHGRKSPSYFLPSDEGLLEKVSVAIGRAIHQWEALGRNRVAKRREDDLLDTVHRAISRSNAIRDRLGIVAKQTREMFHGISASILICNQVDSTLEVVADCSERASVETAVVVPMSRGLVGRCARERRPCVAPQTELDPDFYAPETLGGMLADVRSEMCCPIILDGHLLGVLNVDSDVEFALSEKKVELLLKMARKAAVFLAGCRHGQTLDVDRLDSDSLLHNMQEDLSELMGIASLVADPDESETVRLANGQLIQEKLAAKCDYLRIIGNFQALYDKHPIKMSLMDLADQILLLHENVMGVDKACVFPQQDRVSEVLVDNTQLHLIVANLLSNAVRHSAAGRPVNVSVEEDVDHVSISVFNHGDPIASELRGKIGAEPVNEKDGHGVGLVLAYRLADMNGGSIVCPPREDGTLFKLRLPRVDQNQEEKDA